MKREESLGYFDYRNNGNIYVKMGSNMRFGSEAVTYIHELYHDRLSNFSLLGKFLNFIGIARVISDKDKKYILDKYGDILVKHTRKVQEVYASSKTWLWLNRKGHEKYKKVYMDIETVEYKKYRKELEKVISNERMCIEEREKIVDVICLYALNPDLDEEVFWNCIQDIDKFDKFMEVMVDPENRMYHAYTKIIVGNDLTREKEIDEIGFWKRLCTLEIFKNMSGYVEMVKKQIQNMDVNSNLLEEYCFLREKKIKVFDFSELKVCRYEHKIESDIDVVCIIKGCENLEDKEQNFYIIHHSNYNNESIYLGQELDTVQDFVEKNDFVIIPFAEYDKLKWRPRYFRTNKPIFVMIDNYDDCAQWGKALLDEGELFWGDIYSKDVNNFFTVNFFSKRGKKDVIFVFPTTKKLAFSLQRELGIEKQVLYSKQEEFFKIFGTFRSQEKIFKVYRNLMAFILDSEGSFVNDNALKMMSSDVVNTVFNSSFNILTPDNYYEQLMFFPTKQTVSNGKVWILMEFNESGRIGNIHAVTIDKETKKGVLTKIEGMLVFCNKADAIKYLKQNRDLEYFYPVEIDMIFWNYFKPILIPSKWEIILYNGIKENSAQIIDVEKLEYMLYI